jgi:UDP-2-acetamido-3-amino-2,3-dideoxy-glucuronate N-acetyltransferase
LSAAVVTPVPDYWIHARALCETASVGAGTRVWAFSHILSGAVLGRDCNISDGVFIESDVVLGDRVTVKNGVQLWNGLRVGDDVLIGPNATLAAEPASLTDGGSLGARAPTIIEDGAVLGAGCTITAGVRVGPQAIVSPGAVVSRDVPPNAVVDGNPARITGYADTFRRGVGTPATERDGPVQESSVRGVSVHRLRLVHDMRGDLSVGEFDRDIPFDVARYFVVFNVPNSDLRGGHAHRMCRQFLVCVNGSCAVFVDDGTNRAEIALHEPNVGLFLPPMVWGTQYRFSSDAVLLVFASHLYDPDDYIRDFDEFLAEVGTASSPPANDEQT